MGYKNDLIQVRTSLAIDRSIAWKSACGLMSSCFNFSHLEFRFTSYSFRRNLSSLHKLSFFLLKDSFRRQITFSIKQACSGYVNVNRQLFVDIVKQYRSIVTSAMAFVFINPNVIARLKRYSFIYSSFGY